MSSSRFSDSVSYFFARCKGQLQNKKSRPKTTLAGAVDEARTRDLHLGKVALYQLSYYRKTACAVDGRWSG